MAADRSRWLAAALVAGILMAPGLVFMPWITLGVLAIVATAAATMVWPRQMIVAAFVLIFVGTTKFRIRDPMLSLTGVIDLQVVFELATYAGALMIAILVTRTDSFRATKIMRWDWVLIAYAVLAGVSSLWSVVPSMSAVRAGQLMVLLVLVMVAVRVLGASGLITAILGTAVVYSLVMSGYALFRPGGATTMHLGASAPRFSWLYIHPIAVGEFAGTAALFVLAHCLIPGPVRRFAWSRWLVLFALMAVVVATRSRGPILAFGVAATVLSLRGLTRSWLPSIALPAAIAVVAAAVMVISPVELLRMGEASDSPILSLLYRGQTVEELLSFTGRTELWKGLGPFIQDSYLVGYGYLGGRGLLLSVAPWAGYAHSAFMEILLDLGLLGSLLIWSAVVSALFPGSYDSGVNPPQLRRVRGIVYGVAVFIVLSSITTESFAGAPAFTTMVIMACVIAAGRLRGIPS